MVTYAYCGQGEDGGGAEEHVCKHPGDADAVIERPLSNKLLQECSGHHNQGDEQVGYSQGKEKKVGWLTEGTDKEDREDHKQITEDRHENDPQHEDGQYDGQGGHLGN